MWECVRLSWHSFQLRSISQSGINGHAWNQISCEDASPLNQKKRWNRRLIVTMRKTMLKFECLIYWNCGTQKYLGASRSVISCRVSSIGEQFLRFEDAINVVVREFIVVRAPIIAMSARRDRRVDGILRVVPPVITRRVTHCALSFSSKVMSHRGTWSLTHWNHN